jgi:hypothetical protein
MSDTAGQGAHGPHLVRLLELGFKLFSVGDIHNVDHHLGRSIVPAHDDGRADDDVPCIPCFGHPPRLKTHRPAGLKYFSGFQNGDCFLRFRNERNTPAAEFIQFPSENLGKGRIQSQGVPLSVVHDNRIRAGLKNGPQSLIASLNAHHIHEMT